MLQPISNADFIVPVEIDGTVHQVLHNHTKKPRGVNYTFLSLFPGAKVSEDPEKRGCHPVQVIQDRLCILVGLFVITCTGWQLLLQKEDLFIYYVSILCHDCSKYRCSDLSRSSRTFTDSDTCDTSSPTWPKPCVFCRCMCWNDPTWTSFFKRWGSCLNVYSSQPVLPRCV